MNRSALKHRFLSLLARRDYSRFELLQKAKSWLPRAEWSWDEALQLLDELAAAGHQSDARALESFIRHQRQRRQGRHKIQLFLQRKGFDRESIQEALRDLDFSDELEALYRRKFPRPPSTPTERAKCIRFLSQRGFSYGEIERLLRQALHHE